MGMGMCSAGGSKYGCDGTILATCGTMTSKHLLVVLVAIIVFVCIIRVGYLCSKLRGSMGGMSGWLLV